MNTTQAFRSFRGKSFDEVIASLEDQVSSFSTHTPRSRDVFVTNLMRFLDSPSFQGKNLSDSSWQRFDQAFSGLVEKAHARETHGEAELVKLVHTAQKITKKRLSKLSDGLCPVVVVMRKAVLQNEPAQEEGGLDEHDEASKQMPLSANREVVLPQRLLNSGLQSNVQEGQLDLSELCTEGAFRFVVELLKDKREILPIDLSDFKYLYPFAYKYDCAPLYHPIFDFAEGKIAEFSTKKACELTKEELEFIDCIIETSRGPKYFQDCFLIKLDAIKKEKLREYMEQLLTRIPSSEYRQILFDALAKKMKKMAKEDRDDLFKTLFDPNMQKSEACENAKLQRAKKQFQEGVLESYIKACSDVRVECSLGSELLVPPGQLINIKCVSEFIKLLQELKLSELFPKIIFCVRFAKDDPASSEFFKAHFREFAHNMFFNGSEKSNYAFWPKTIELRVAKNCLSGDESICLGVQNAAKSALLSLIDERPGFKEAISDITIQVEARLYGWSSGEVIYKGGPAVV